MSVVEKEKLNFLNEASAKLPYKKFIKQWEEYLDTLSGETYASFEDTAENLENHLRTYPNDRMKQEAVSWCWNRSIKETQGLDNKLRGVNYFCYAMMMLPNINKKVVYQVFLELLYRINQDEQIRQFGGFKFEDLVTLMAMRTGV